MVYNITPSALEDFLQKHFQALETNNKRKKPTKEQKAYIDSWLRSMAKGTLTGKVYSDRTIKDYQWYVEKFYQQFRELTLETLKKALMKIDPVHFCKREHLYKACLCFSRYLAKEGAADASLPDELKALAQKRHLPAKRHTVKVKEDELQRLYEGCQSLQDRAIVALLSTTGLRASEVCALNVSDIDLMEGVLTVQCGKGGKRRQVGLSPSALAALSKQIESLTASSKAAPVFLDLNGKRMTPRGLHARLERIGKAVGVTANPHALRRAFVTINANKGRPIHMLQRACGHCEQEVINAMKDL